MALRAYADNIKRSYIDACNAVLARGGNVSSGMPISDLSSAILNIPHDQTLAYYKQENTKRIITVPRNSEPYARIGKIGGMTYKSENYFDKSKVTNSDVPLTVTDTGFSFTNTVADKQPTPIGYLKNLAPELKVGDIVTFYANVVNASIDRGYGFLYITEAKVDWLGGNFITITEAHLSGMVYAYGALNKVCEYKNLIITKEENAPYSPYFEGLRDTKVTELVSEGANLLNLDDAIIGAGSEGETAIRLTDGKWQSNVINYYFCSLQFPTLINFFSNHKGEQFTFSAEPAIPNRMLSVIFWGTNTQGDASAADISGENGASYVTFTVPTDLTVNRIELRFNRNRNSTFTDTTTIFYDFQINHGGYAPYKPFRADSTDTLPISAELRAFLADKGYGRGISGYPNYIDFNRKVFVQNTYRKVFDGTEDILDGGLNTAGLTRYSFRVPQKAPDKSDNILCISSHYTNGSANETYRSSETVLGANENYIRWTDTEIPTFSLAEMRAKLKAWYDAGDPLIVEYVMAEPIEYDISAYLIDDFIKVEGDGTITAISEYNYDMPSEVNYIINTVGG